MAMITVPPKKAMFGEWFISGGQDESILVKDLYKPLPKHCVPWGDLWTGSAKKRSSRKGAFLCHFLIGSAGQRLGCWQELARSVAILRLVSNETDDRYLQEKWSMHVRIFLMSILAVAGFLALAAVVSNVLIEHIWSLSWLPFHGWYLLIHSSLPLCEKSMHASREWLAVLVMWNFLNAF